MCVLYEYPMMCVALRARKREEEEVAAPAAEWGEDAEEEGRKEERDCEQLHNAAICFTRTQQSHAAQISTSRKRKMRALRPLSLSILIHQTFACLEIDRDTHTHHSRQTDRREKLVKRRGE